MIEEAEKLFRQSDGAVTAVAKRDSGMVAAKNTTQTYKLPASVPLPTALPNTAATPGAPPAKTAKTAAPNAPGQRAGPNSNKGRAGPVGGAARPGPSKPGPGKRK